MSRTAFVLSAAAALLVATAASAADAPKGDPVKGRATFVRVGCYSCHDYEGQGAQTGPKLAPDPLAWPALSTFVRNTTGRMPPFTQRVLSDADLADIYAFLQSIPKSPDPKTIRLLQ